MSFGALLALLALVLAVVAAFTGFAGGTRYGAYSPRLLAIAVVLLALAVLLGGGKLLNG